MKKKRYWNRLLMQMRFERSPKLCHWSDFGRKWLFQRRFVIVVLFLTVQLCNIESKFWLEWQKGSQKCFHALIWIERWWWLMAQSWIEYFVIVITYHILSYHWTDDKVDKLNEITLGEVIQNDCVGKSRMIKVIVGGNDSFSEYLCF
jgi:hypothetical protein